MLSEHWLKRDEPVSIPNYCVVDKYCRQEFLHGGTMCLINSQLLESCLCKRECKFDELLEEKVFEFSLMFVSNINLYVLCIYRSPLGNVDVFFSKMETLLSRLPVKARLILCGDLNIDFSSTNCPNAQYLKNLLLSHGLQSHIDRPTRITKQSATMIDYMCSNIDDCEIQANVISAGISDHEAVTCRVRFNHHFKHKRIKKGRLFTRKNYSKFVEVCQGSFWQDILKSSDPLGSFHNKLCKIFEFCFPITTIKTKKTKKNWLTKGLKVSSKNMRCLHWLRKYYCMDTNFSNIYFNYRRIYRATIRTAKKLYYYNKINQASNKQKEIWNIVNDLCQRSSYKNSEVPDSNLSSNELNSFYCSIASKLSANISNKYDFHKYMSHVSVSNSFYFSPTNVEETKRTITKIKNKKSHGWDDLAVKIFEKLPDCVLSILAESVNLSFLSGRFPQCLKLATIIPIFKGGDKNQPSDFRPIALLPTLSKIVEKLVKERMISFLDKNMILSKEQFGFQVGSGTNEAIFPFLEKLYLNLNRKQSASAVFCDLKKAFDCVNHSILLSKLEKYGFRGNTLKWFQSYLSARTQKVLFRDELSNEQEVTHGVPQGSVLGPILFLLYINDITGLKISGSFTLFADDATIAWSHANEDELKRVVNNDICEVKKWCDSNLLTLNINKTCIMNFKCSIEVSVDEHTLSNLEENKFLGIYIDSNLKFEAHIGALQSKLSSGCFAIKVLGRQLETHTVRIAYFGLIESHLRYGICFWGSCSNQQFQKLFVLQKRAVRFMCGTSSRETCRPLFVEQRLLTLTCLYVLETASLVHKRFFEQIQAVKPNNTRSSHRVPLPIPFSALIKKSLIYNSKAIFNHLPLSIRSIEVNKIFRKKLKKLLLVHPFYTINEYFEASLD